MRTLFAIASLAALSTGPRCAADEPPVRLGRIPDLKPTPRPPADAARIKGLIADLAKLGHADVGLSATLAGDDFAPVPGQSRVGMLLLTDHQIKPSPTLRELVALGPDALPYLLESLDDRTPTRITIRHDGAFGVMWYGGELRTNPVNPAEAAVSKARAARPQPSEEPIRSHTVTVGDVCFVAVGQIVGRGYSAVRYQPTACAVINSPTHDAKLCVDVRAMWASKDSTRKLFDSLLADYATEGGSHWQCGAALRLLYYFPADAAPLVAGRLNRLDVGPPDPLGQSVASGVLSEDFIGAVAWCREPTVRAAVVAVFKRAETTHDALAALPAIDDVKLIHDRLEPLVAKLPPDDNPHHEGHTLLRAVVERTPATAKPVFQKYLRDASPERCLTACAVLREVAVTWDVEVLGPLLTDRRETWRTYRVDPTKPKPERPERVCDAAAGTLAHRHPDLSFALRGSHTDLDEQIAAMRERLKRRE